MPKNSKKGNNAFYFFMIDWRKQQEKNGRTFPEGMKDVSRDPLLAEAWQKLPQQQKGIYEARAKDSKIQAQGSMSKKTALGENIEEVLAAEKREQEFHQNMLQYIDSVVSMGKLHHNLEKIKFIFVHVNWFFRKEIGINKYDYYPAEFAVAEFSLESGLENLYHEIINVAIPLGYKREAYETSMETHKITVELEAGEDDFALMYEKFVEILNANKTGNKFPPLFTVKDMSIAVESLLRRMTEAAGKPADEFVIYSLEALFGALRNVATEKVDNQSIPLVVAEVEFAKDVFSSQRDLECAYHKNIDGTALYCSMAVVKRWGFTICDHCCEYLGVTVIDGIHRPISQAECTFSKMDSIDSQLSNLSISNDPVNIVSMTGVSENYRRKVSERTYQEDQRRRNECKPLNIIDHSARNTVNPTIPGRPLRLPKTIPRGLNDTDENINYLNPSDFPPIGGRGIAIPQKTVKGTKFPLGRALFA